MTRALSPWLVCCGVLLLAGCGSSTSSSSSSTPAAGSTQATGAKTSSTGIKVNTTPKFASPPASAPVKSGVVAIAYRNIAINPDVVKVKVGATIEWTNYDPVEHNVTSRSARQAFASKNFGEGATFSIKAQRPGTIHYLCTIHPATMNGTIEVVR